MISPCILLCCLDPKTGYCTGCGRTGGEIGAWTGYTDQERRDLMALLPARLAALAGRPAEGSAAKRERSDA